MWGRGGDVFPIALGGILVSACAALAAAGQAPAESPVPPFAVSKLADGVYAVPGDTGRGSEGRPNAGFIVTHDGVAVVDAEASPLQGKRLLAAVRTVTPAPIKWLILTHHHPDHMFGAIVFKRQGAAIIAHPDRTFLARENGDEGLVADWDRVMGLHELQGFAFADTPTIPVPHDTTLVLGGRRVVLYHPAGAAHTPGDLAIWLPAERVLFAGDLLIEDGVAMVVDGNSGVLLAAIAHLDSLGARVVVPGHGRIAPDPRAQMVLTRVYFDSLRASMRRAVERGLPMAHVLGALPPPDSGRPISLASRKQRNAERVYLEMERQVMGASP
jgi:glyoxylase-like metal-dependent hydrolase (beta-lactamase superfamily II)